jgi:hypothetical protein
MMNLGMKRTYDFVFLLLFPVIMRSQFQREREREREREKKKNVVELLAM